MVPNLTLFQVFRQFLGFGLRAWGGAFPQIQMLKEELVIRDDWITLETFNRVFAVYQVLPGPEAAELCMYFGFLARNRPGAFVAGIGFLLPGFVSIMFFSWIYTLIGTTNIYFNASFKALQPLVAAMFIRAVHKIAVDSIYDRETGKLHTFLFIISFLTALNTALRINMFVSMFFFGFVYSTYSKNYRKVSFAMVGAFYISYICIVAFTGFPSENNLSVGVSPSPSPWNILALGALAGSISFGGAYTVIPIILQEAVIRGGWISQKTFLDGVALANVLPAPTVIFSTFVGFIGGKVFSGGDLNGVGGNVGYGFLGGLLMTIGIFAAPFLFAVIGHPYLVKLTENKSLASFFDGITASVVGLIGTTSLEILSAAISPSVTAESMNSINAVIFGMSIYTMYNFKFPNQALILVLVTALSGQFLYKSR